MPSVIEKLETESTIQQAVYQPSKNILIVKQKQDGIKQIYRFTDTEIELMQEGKLVPNHCSGMEMAYDVKITLEEQEENKSDGPTRFTFSQ